jgi:hypothetical protein
MTMTELLNEMRERLGQTDGPVTLASPLLRVDEAWKLRALVSEVERLSDMESMPTGTRVAMRDEVVGVKAWITPGATGTVIQYAKTSALVGFDGAGEDPAFAAWVPVRALRKVAA